MAAVDNHSDVNRFMAVLRGEIPDRVPNYEVLIGRRTACQILGETDLEDSWNMAPEETVRLAESIGMDMLATPIGGWDLLSSVRANGHTGALTHKALSMAHFDFLRCIEPSLTRMRTLVDICRPSGIGVCASPNLVFDRAVYAIGFEAFFLAIHDDRKFVEDVLDICAEYSSRCFTEVCRYDITAIHAGDDIAGKSGLFLNPALFRELWLPRLRRILRPAREKGIPLIFHSDGNVREIIPDLIDLGFCAINPLEPYSNDIYRIKEEFGDRITLIGNIDIAEKLSLGTRQMTIADVREHLARLMPGGRYICSSSHSITDTVKPENFLAMVQTIHEFGRWR